MPHFLRLQAAGPYPVSMASDSEADWRLKPPYKPPGGGSQFQRAIRGSCHCKKVVYWIGSHRPLASKFCHCPDCQVMHGKASAGRVLLPGTDVSIREKPGAPFQWAAIFQKSDVAFETGAEYLKFYHSATKETRHKLPCKVGCVFCGSHIMDEGRNTALVFPPLLSLTAVQRQNFEVQ
ncbi:Mss4-like protein [Metarhizium album ARSEF 1941]|uniref:Mss4-like protein n=1 Tax=Metarhizium album (strain ARSEF 1941) TaxID=1081103 RepID=A0A0B2WKK8_METAS|nr:Mss4-like protein [Metarhizium album ARSEF 1941]KHN94017.1 Mss4-like protein [Metarhizium album ARSEF 1941]